MDSQLAIERIDHRQLVVAQQLHAVQMIAYAQEARLLGAVYFPPLERTVEEVQASAEEYFAALLDGKLVGAASVRPDPEGMGTNIASLVVAPQFQRRGVGTALLGRVLTAHGNNELTVQTGAKNLPALALYARFGFVELRRWSVGREPLELVKLRRVSSNAYSAA
jgi:ribosomal protein S18 acetylase RimI-like enzyme